MAKMDKKWVVLCSTAVAAVYASGFFTTESQAANLMPTHQTQLKIQTSSSPPYSRRLRNHHLNNDQASGEDSQSNSTVDNNSGSSSQSNNQSNSQPNKQSNQSNGQYKNGTYTGHGMNRRGFIEVTVTVKNNKISDVEISNWGMHYDESDVDGLPQEVVQNQNPQVQNVSGATYSTEAFQDAVRDALSKANA